MTKAVVIKAAWDKYRLRKLRKLVLKGYNDPEIARIMDASVQVVGRQRRKFGLPSPGNGSEGSRRRQGVVMSWRNKGVPQEIARCKAAVMGWMCVDGPGKARVLEVLFKRQTPMTTRDISGVLKVTFGTVWQHLRALYLDKLVVCVGKRSLTGQPENLWQLADGVTKHVTSIDHRYHRRS